MTLKLTRAPIPRESGAKTHLLRRRLNWSLYSSLLFAHLRRSIRGDCYSISERLFQPRPKNALSTFQPLEKATNRTLSLPLPIELV